jgi:protein phosphatase 2C
VRRLRPAASRFSPSSSSQSASQGSSQEEADPEVQEMELAPLTPAGLQPEPEPEPVAAVAAQQVWPVAFGSVTMAGRMRIMEDTVSLHPNLCTWAADGSPMHFFAVFDGHGGTHVRVVLSPSPGRRQVLLISS